MPTNPESTASAINLCPSSPEFHEPVWSILLTWRNTQEFGLLLSTARRNACFLYQHSVECLDRSFARSRGLTESGGMRGRCMSSMTFVLNAISSNCWCDVLIHVSCTELLSILNIQSGISNLEEANGFRRGIPCIPRTGSSWFAAKSDFTSAGMLGAIANVQDIIPRTEHSSYAVHALHSNLMSVLNLRIRSWRESNLRNEWRTRNAAYHRPYHDCCRRRPVVACEPVHPNAGTNQINPERSGRHRFGFVDREPLRAVSTPPSISRRALTCPTLEACTASPANLRQQDSTAALWLQEIL
jgi:hypothetical protein